MVRKIETIKYLFRLSNLICKMIFPPLHISCGMGHLQVVQLLVKKGANVNTVANGICPLVAACFHHEIVGYLLSLPQIECDPHLLNYFCVNASFESFKKLFESGKIDVHTSTEISIKKYKENLNVLQVACLYNKLDVVKYLIEKNFDVNDGSPSPLCISYFEKNVDAVKILLSHPDIDVNITFKKNKVREDKKNIIDENASLLTTAWGSEIAPMIYTHKNFIYSKHPNGNYGSPLMLMLNDENFEGVHYLLKNCEIDFSVTNQYGSDCFHIAIYKLNYPAIKMMIAAGYPSELLHRKNYQRMAPLDCITSKVKPYIANLIHEFDADPVNVRIKMLKEHEWSSKEAEKFILFKLCADGIFETHDQRIQKLLRIDINILKKIICPRAPDWDIDIARQKIMRKIENNTY